MGGAEFFLFAEQPYNESFFSFGVEGSLQRQRIYFGRKGIFHSVGNLFCKTLLDHRDVRKRK